MGTPDEKVYNDRVTGELTCAGKKFKMIDLYCGAGGLTLGFTPKYGHSFEQVWANDINKHAIDTYRENFGEHCQAGDLVEILKNNGKISPADVVVGGPPCQGFSLLNKNRIGDERNALWKPFMEVVSKSGAKVFLIENVPHLLGTPEHAAILKCAEEMGFKACSTKLCAADYGVPQTRWRAFIIGCKTNDPQDVFPPKKTHFNPLNGGVTNGAYIKNPEKWRTVRDAIADLPPPKGKDVRVDAPPLDLHFGRTPTDLSKARYRAIPKEGMNRFDLQKNAPDLTPQCWIKKTSGGTDLFGRLWWDRPAFTIRTEFFKPEKGRYLHPIQHRPITHREAARFQSFVDDFIFKGTKIEIAKQIGNAVPPLLAARIADSIYALLSL